MSSTALREELLLLEFTRSHGGLPTTQVKPPCQPVSGLWSGLSSSSARNTPGNSRCQWKNWYRPVSRSSSSSHLGRRGVAVAQAAQGLGGDRCRGVGVFAPDEGGAPGVRDAFAFPQGGRLFQLAVAAGLLADIGEGLGWHRGQPTDLGREVGVADAHGRRSNRPSWPPRSFSFCRRKDAAIFGSSPSIGLNAASGTPGSSSFGVVPNRALPTLMCASRYSSGWPGSRDSSQSDTLASSAASGLMSTP